MTRKQQIIKLLKGIETGDPTSVSVVNEAKYIQHNPLTRTGSVGLAELFKRLAKTNPRVEIVRVFEDGEYVFAHTDYDFNVIEVGFEVFRFEDGQVVEHWDNLQTKPSHPNRSGRSMLDGSTTVEDLDKTETNRALARSFVEEVLVHAQLDRLDAYVGIDEYVEHNPEMSDGRDALRAALSCPDRQRQYQTVHRVLAEGNFVLCVAEGVVEGDAVSFYDLFRIANGRIVEHWDTIDEVPPRDQWVNDNGKF